MDWRIAGTYLEACNCDPICPCRTVDGRSGGRSTHGECLGALSWRVEEGHVDGLDLAGSRAVMAIRYDDDEPGSPWSFILYLDRSIDAGVRDALAGILTGDLGGTPTEQFPWVFKPSDLLETRVAEIAIDHTPGRGWFRAADEVTVRVREPFPDQGRVTCVIPGHDRPGTEVVTEQLRVSAGPLTFELADVCGYESTFDYSGPGS
ncbi:MAG: DUF1326 domain-containing protein [Solirubrobacterales bacterium]